MKIDGFNNPVNQAGLLVHDLGSVISAIKTSDPIYMKGNAEILQKECQELLEIIIALNRTASSVTERN